MPWESRIKSNKTRQFVITTIMFVMLGLSTAAAIAIQKSRNSNSSFEDIKSVEINLPDYQFSLPDFYQPSEKIVPIAMVEDVTTTQIARYQHKDDPTTEIVIINFQFPHAINSLLAHREIRKYIGLPYPHSTSSLESIQAVGYQSWRDGSQSQNQSNFANQAPGSKYFISTLSLDARNFLAIVSVGKGHINVNDFLQHQMVSVSITNKRFQSYPFDSKKMQLEYQGLSLPVIKGISPYIIKDDDSQSLYFLSHGTSQPFIIRLAPVSLENYKPNTHPDTPEGASKARNEKLQYIIKAAPESISKRYPRQMKWRIDTLNGGAVAYHDITTLRNNGMNQRVYITTINEKQGLVIHTLSPQILTPGVYRVVAKILLKIHPAPNDNAELPTGTDSTDKP